MLDFFNSKQVLTMRISKTAKEVHMKKHSVTTLLTNLQKIHTTQKGAERIARNLTLNKDVDALSYCMKKLKEEHFIAYARGKNWYIEFEDCVLTVHISSYTIITAHKA